MKNFNKVYKAFDELKIIADENAEAVCIINNMEEIFNSNDCDSEKENEKNVDLIHDMLSDLEDILNPGKYEYDDLPCDKFIDCVMNITNGALEKFPVAVAIDDIPF